MARSEKGQLDLVLFPEETNIRCSNSNVLIPLVKHIHLNSVQSTSTSTKLSSAQNIMARRSSPAPGTGTDLKLSLGVSSIQDSVHAKLEVLVAISRSNRQKLQQLLENKKNTPGGRPAKKIKVTKPCSVSFFSLIHSFI